MPHPTDRVRLDLKPAVVVVAKPPSPQPSIIVGAMSHPIVGPAVAIGASCAIPQLGPLAFLAHLSPADARDFAGKIMAAADEVDQIGPSDPIAVGEALAEKIEAEKPPEEPPIRAVPDEPEESSIVFPEMLAFPALVLQPDGFLIPPVPGVANLALGATHAEGAPAFVVSVDDGGGRILAAIVPIETANRFALHWTDLKARIERGEFNHAGPEAVQ